MGPRWDRTTRPQYNVTEVRLRIGVSLACAWVRGWRVETVDFSSHMNILPGGSVVPNNAAYTSVTHMSPGRTASIAILVPNSYLHARHFSRFQNLKNPATLPYPDCRDLTSLCLRLCIGVKLRRESSKWSLDEIDGLSFHPRPPFTALKRTVGSSAGERQRQRALAAVGESVGGAESAQSPGSHICTLIFFFFFLL